MKYIVTSALPYVNNIPHLGNLVCIISADVYQRYLKNRGEDVLSVLGTDEHGTTTERIAIEKDMTPQEVVEHYREIHKESYDWFNCDFDCFGTTSSDANHCMTKRIFKKLDQNGYIKEKEIEQLYDTEKEKFLSDRFVEGECPHCGFQEARGDQCDDCGKLLDPLELINPVSKLSGTEPVVRTTKHLFLKLDDLQPQTEEHFHTVKEKFSPNARETTKAWFTEGLEERAITRDLDWGINVPKEGYEEKVFYVWFDAPIGYISISQEQEDDWKSYWKNPDNTNLIQFMGKDNILFHSVIFPASLIGTDETWTLVDSIESNEYLNYEDKQFSKSRNVGVFADNAQDSGIHPDIWRYYLMINRPEQQDTTFTWTDFQEKINTGLVNNYGNLITRVTTLLNKTFDGTISTASQKPYKAKLETIKNLYDNQELKKGLKETMKLSRQANTYLQQHKPWKHPKQNPEQTKETLTTMVNWIKDITILLNHVLPEKTRTIKEQLGIDIDLTLENLHTDIEDQSINVVDAPFTKLDDETITTLKEKYEGKPDYANLDLRIARIESVKDHPNADKLYVIEVSLGDETRQIVSGLVPYYQKKDLKGKKIVLLANLETATIRGEQSNGMLLAVESQNDVGILQPDGNVGDELRFGTTEHDRDQTIHIDDFTSLDITADDYVMCEGDQLYPEGKITVDKGLSGNVS